ncbi:ATP synthase subunit b [Iodidimonas gelatinilytica]|uniref:ATP synthase subunit b n=1 Tax=Iodidimonas gelatinilytica TaxID=1236966 RepID=A0A5A7MYM4_9PROT|nr:F0F1 ATP synthase subunit B [Iodidimonas gelatinilytica]GEQ98007.1 ATP synthase subunit b [Iodidimonas gelatinilytica]GEQ99875.1 ATP synthase subunit b [Iodidimonas gelatinilytica]
MAQTSQNNGHQELVEVDAHHGEEGLFQSAEFYVALGFVIFVALLLYFGIHKMIAKALDDRSAKIAGQIDEARQLREEAQADLAQRQRRQREAASEADAIIAQAEDDARLMTSEAMAEINRVSTRREEVARQKIKQAEQDALRNLRAEATDIAVKAARTVIADKLSGKKGSDLIATTIKGLDA